MTNTKQTQYKLEDFKVGQNVKVLVGLGSYVSEINYSRLGEVGKIVEIDYISVRVVFETPIKGEYDQWYRAEEILLQVPTTNAEREEEIARLDAQIHELNATVVKLMKEIKDNPEKIKAEAGDTVKFTYKALGECFMFIMTKEQAEFFDPDTRGYGDFVFVGADGLNSVDVVTRGNHLKLEFKKKGTYAWIDSKEVDWSGILPK